MANRYFILMIHTVHWSCGVFIIKRQKPVWPVGVTIVPVKMLDSISDLDDLISGPWGLCLITTQQVPSLLPFIPLSPVLQHKHHLLVRSPPTMMSFSKHVGSASRNRIALYLEVSNVHEIPKSCYVFVENTKSDADAVTFLYCIILLLTCALTWTSHC